MKIIVFNGPTLKVEDGRRILDAIYRPPASQGDVYRATLEAPWAIGLIDGYFDGVPAVWHKEILWAMSYGIHVFGAASMGALRAAELHTFGMVGVGAVFEAYRQGLLDDDDDVAVVHGPPELGYVACSEAMVNIRATMCAAVSASIVTEATAGWLIDIAKSSHFPDRTWPYLCAAAIEQGVSASQIAALQTWLPGGRIDQKRSDAQAMLKVMAEQSTLDPSPKLVTYDFEYTDKWDRLVRRVEETVSITGHRDLPLAALMEEVKLERGRYEVVRQAALLRMITQREALRHGIGPDWDQLHQTAEAFRKERGLLAEDQILEWLDENRLSPGEFRTFLEAEAQHRWFMAMADQITPPHLIDQLRVEGHFGRLLARALDKHRVLTTDGSDSPEPDQTEIDEDELVAWFIHGDPQQTLDRVVDDHARAYGFDDRKAFLQALAREHRYVRCLGLSGAGPAASRVDA